MGTGVGQTGSVRAGRAWVPVRWCYGRPCLRQGKHAGELLPRVPVRPARPITRGRTGTWSAEFPDLHGEAGKVVVQHVDEAADRAGDVLAAVTSVASHLAI